MRKIPVLVLCTALVSLFSCASTGQNPDALSLDEAIERSATELAAELSGGTRVAIVAFSSEHENLSNYIMDELTGALVDGSLEVADRRNLAFVYKELGFQMSGDASDESAVSIGKFLGASYVITGQIVKAGNRYRYRLAGINVETAVQESSTRLDVRDDRAFQSLLADIRNDSVATTAADYGESAVTAKTIGAHLDRGILFATRRDWDLAIAEFTEAINLDSGLMSAYMLRGRALNASVSYVTDINEDFSGFSSFFLQQNASDEQKAVYDRAIADYNQAIRLDPNDVNARNNLEIVRRARVL
jgi:tetratricopeptide (TPR) repeat protein